MDVGALREVHLSIGKRTYDIMTPLSDETLERLKGMIGEAAASVDEGSGQEDLLVLACLRLAYALDELRDELDEILDRLGRAEGDGPEDRRS